MVYFIIALLKFFLPLLRTTPAFRSASVKALAMSSTFSSFAVTPPCWTLRRASLFELHRPVFTSSVRISTAPSVRSSALISV